MLNKYAAKIIQHKGDTAIIEAVGGQAQIKQLLEALEQFGIKELVRTGRVAMAY
jgi:acetolactate synthase small subunit